MIHNVHERAFPVSGKQLGELLDRVAEPNSPLWPVRQWPPMVLDRPLRVGAAGGHGPIRYHCTAYQPGRRAEFTFDIPMLRGTHALEVDGNTLRHVLSGRPAGAGHLLWPLVFRWLHGLARNQVGADRADLSRRNFLRSGAGVVVGAGVLGGAGQLLANRVDVEGSRAAIGHLTPAEPAPTAPATGPIGPDFAANGTPTFITANRDFYRIDTALTLPRVRAEDWHLRIHGLVDKELSFSFNDIRNRPLIERPVTLTCVSNEVGGEYISTANFTGVLLRDLLRDAGVKPGSDQLFSTSVDGFTAGTPVDALLDPNRGAMLAIGMNGEPLPLEHGFPARMVVPGLYGYVSATKWVVDMELTTFNDKQGYWVPRGWAARGPIKTQSRIDNPRDGATVRAGGVVVAGISWAQFRGISKVEVRLDGGDWQETQLSTEVSKNTWRMWRTTIQVPKGDHQLAVRATDTTGYTQTDQQAPPDPDGATGWHTIGFHAS